MQTSLAISVMGTPFLPTAVRVFALVPGTASAQGITRAEGGVSAGSAEGGLLCSSGFWRAGAASTWGSSVLSPTGLAPVGRGLLHYRYGGKSVLFPTGLAPVGRGLLHYRYGGKSVLSPTGCQATFIFPVQRQLDFPSSRRCSHPSTTIIFPAPAAGVVSPPPPASPPTAGEALLLLLPSVPARPDRFFFACSAR
jgi:hypothetical protein